MNFYKEKHALATLLISYILILLIPLSVMSFVYINIEDVLQGQISEYYEKLLQQNQQSADSVVGDLINLMMGISKNNEMLKITQYNKQDLETNRYDIQSNRKLYLYSGFDNIIEDMFIYFKNMDYVVGIRNCDEPKKYFYSQCVDYFTDYSQWHALMVQRHSMRFVSTTPNKSDDIFLMNSIVNLGDDEPVANVVFKIKASVLLNNAQKADEAFFFIMNENNEVILSSAQSNINAIATIVSSEQLSKFNINFKGNDYIVLKTRSSKANWDYVFCINKSEYLYRITQTRQVISIGIIACILIGAVLIIYLTKKQYEPITKITKKLRDKFGEQGKEVSEYQYIENAIERIMKENSNLVDRSLAEEMAINEFALSKMLKDNRCNEKLRNMVENLFPYNNFIVAIITFEDLEQIFFDDQNTNKWEDEVLARFIVFNVLKDILNDRYTIETCEINNNQVVVIAMRVLKIWKTFMTNFSRYKLL